MKTLSIKSQIEKTKRNQYVDSSVLESCPTTTGNLQFFKIGKAVSVKELADEYEKRGLEAAPLRLVQYDLTNEGRTELDTKKYIATQWQDKDGNFCYLTFNRWLGRRNVFCDRRSSGYFGIWWFAGVPVAGKSSKLNHSTLDLESLELRIKKLEEWRDRIIGVK